MQSLEDKTLYADLLGKAITDCPDWEKIKKNSRETAVRFDSDSQIAQSKRSYLVGSGDSLFAARSAVPALRRWTGLYIEDRTSIEFSRYEVELLGREDVLIAVSNSGSSTRTREAIILAKKKGIPTVGITGSLEGPLAKSVDIVLHRPVKEFTLAPEDIRRGFLHAAEFCATLYALYVFGLNLGLIRGVIDSEHIKKYESSIHEALTSIGKIANALEKKAIDFVDQYPRLENIWVIGAGPNRGTAEYAAAKFHEQIPINGVPQDLEEWAHLQYFLTLDWKEKSVIIILAPEGKVLDRCMEILTGVENANGTSVLVTNSSNSLKMSNWDFPISFQIDELLTPLIFHIPSQLMAFHWARKRYVRPTPLRRLDNFWLIREGQICKSIS